MKICLQFISHSWPSDSYLFPYDLKTGDTANVIYRTGWIQYIILDYNKEHSPWRMVYNLSIWNIQTYYQIQVSLSTMSAILNNILRFSYDRNWHDGAWTTQSWYHWFDISQCWHSVGVALIGYHVLVEARTWHYGTINLASYELPSGFIAGGGGAFRPTSAK